MSTFISVAPRVAHDYWSAIEKQDLDTARRIIKEIDLPFFDYIGKLTGGRDAGIHGVLELYGIAQRWRRKPYYSLDDSGMDALKEFLATLKIPQPSPASPCRVRSASALLAPALAACPSRASGSSDDEG